VKGEKKMLDRLQKKLLKTIANVTEETSGALSIRSNGGSAKLVSTPSIQIVPLKGEKSGLNITIADNTVGESVHIPAIMTEPGVEMVYNNFFIGKNADVEIIAGCGVHTCGDNLTQHDGVHSFVIGENSRMKYVENHYGESEMEGGKNILNPKTVIEVMNNGTAELEMVQIDGIDETIRDTEVILHDNAKLIITERLLTKKKQKAVSNVIVKLMGENSSAQVISRSVAKDDSVQIFNMSIEGHNISKGHIQCDSIIMGNARVESVPKIIAVDSRAELIHEAAIGRINSDQIIKLKTLGIDQEEAEDIILKGFLS
jgi:Fe-S cluster assembly scaffold protein SufB